MQFPLHTDDAARLESSSVDPAGENGGFSDHKRGYFRSFTLSPRFAASGNPNGTNQDNHTDGTSFPAKHADDEARQKTPSLRSLPTEPDGQEKQTPGIKAIFGGAGNTMARKGSVRTIRSTHTTGKTRAFADGAPLMGSSVEPDIDESLFARSIKAEQSLSQKQKDRITIEESRFSDRNIRMVLMQRQKRSPRSSRSFSGRNQPQKRWL